MLSGSLSKGTVSASEYLSESPGCSCRYRGTSPPPLQVLLKLQRAAEVATPWPTTSSSWLPSRDNKGSAAAAGRQAGSSGFSCQPRNFLHPSGSCSIFTFSEVQVVAAHPTSSPLPRAQLPKQVAAAAAAAAVGMIFDAAPDLGQAHCTAACRAPRTGRGTLPMAHNPLTGSFSITIYDFMGCRMPQRAHWERTWE